VGVGFGYQVTLDRIKIFSGPPGSTLQVKKSCGTSEAQSLKHRIRAKVLKLRVSAQSTGVNKLREDPILVG